MNDMDTRLQCSQVVSREEHTCRECADRKHNACDGFALWFDAADQPHEVRCDCAENGHQS